MTTDLPTAATIIGIGRTLAQDLARTGDFPVRVLRLGRRVVVPVADLLTFLGADPSLGPPMGELTAPGASAASWRTRMGRPTTRGDAPTEAAEYADTTLGEVLIQFTLDGAAFNLTAQEVEHRLQDVRPERVRHLGVRVNGTVYPVKQALEVAIGRPRTGFTSHTARRVVAALGFPLVGDVQHRSGSTAHPAPSARSGRHLSGRPPTSSSGPAAASILGPSKDWYCEANVQGAVITHLVAAGWQILSVADTARRERGIDVTATRGGLTVAIEVKGYPSRDYADPARAGDIKPTHPSNQARHWYAGAVLTAMITNHRQPGNQTVIALPDFPRYRDLHHETQTSLQACGISVWWVTAQGVVGR